MTHPNIARNLEDVRARITAAAAHSGRSADEITLVAVTKTQPAEAVQAALDAGVRHIGENYVAEAEAKFPDIRWPEGVTRHLIGHLQSNKAARAVDTFDMIQSVDSLRLARRLNTFAAARDLVLPVLVEVRLSDEPNKTGIAPGELSAAMDGIQGLENLSVRGLMGMAPFTDDKKAVRLAFQTLRNHILTLHNVNEAVLSMGMTGDFEIAIEEGSTMVRVGTAIFGARAA